MFTKTIKDYYEEMYKKFPDVPKKDIRTILNYGWKSIYLHNSYGGDFQTKDKDFNCYFGNLTYNSLKHFKYYLSKLKVKIRVIYKRKLIPWDGYYYFALTHKQWDEYLKQINKTGRPKKYFTFGNQILYQIKDECKIANWNRKYIFRVPFLIYCGYSIYKPNYKTLNAEFIEKRDSIKFDAFLTLNNNFKNI